MATTLHNIDETYLHTLEQAQQDLWNRNSHLSQQQREALWLSAASIPSNALDVNVNQIPRSMAYSPVGLAQTPVWNTLLVVALLF
jgi:hypothetical protein